MSRKKLRSEMLDQAIEEWWESAQDSGYQSPPPPLVTALAKRTGYSNRQVKRRILAHMGLVCPPARWEPTETDLLAVFLWSGRLAQAYTDMGYRERRVDVESGVVTRQVGPSLSTFKRRIKRELGAIQLAHARSGSLKVRDTQLYLKNPEPPHRNVRWELDHTELPNLVVPTGHTTPVKPWLTVVIDVKHRVVLGWAVTYGMPTQESVRAALMQAIHLRWENGVALGGRPIVAIWDRGLEFLAELISDACNTLHFAGMATPPMSPNLKGTIEAWNKIVKAELCPPLPGYTKGARDLRGRSSLENHAMSEEIYTAKLTEWIDKYNHERPHGSLRGLTPVQSWAADLSPLDVVPDEELWFGFLKHGQKVKVSKNGVRFRTVDFTAPELNRMGGRLLEVKYLPSDHSFIELFENGAYVCTAHPHESLSPEERERFYDARRKEREAASQLLRKANQRRLQPFGPGDVHDLRVIPAEAPAVTVHDEYDLSVGADEALEALIGDSTVTAQGALF